MSFKGFNLPYKRQKQYFCYLQVQKSFVFMLVNTFFIAKITHLKAKKIRFLKLLL